MFKKIIRLFQASIFLIIPGLSLAFSRNQTTGITQIDQANNTGYSILQLVAGFTIIAGFFIGGFMLFMSPGEGATKLFFKLIGAVLCIAVGFYAVPQLFNFTIA